MRIREADSVKAARLASEKRDIEAEIWSRHGWQEGEPVTRVEVQVRGTALQELCNRCEVRIDTSGATPEERDAAFERAKEESIRQFEESVDGIWQYATRKWLRLIERTRTRRSRCPTHPWWKKVQEVSFFRRTEKPLRRIRKRSAAKSAQVLGAAMGLTALHGLHSPWVDTSDPKQWKIKDERIAAKRIDHEGLARWRLTWEVGRILDAAKEHIVRDMIDKAPSLRDALERFICRWGAVTARYQPGEQERSATGPPEWIAVGA